MVICVHIYRFESVHPAVCLFLALVKVLSITEVLNLEMVGDYDHKYLAGKDLEGGSCGLLRVVPESVWRDKSVKVLFLNKTWSVATLLQSVYKDWPFCGTGDVTTRSFYGLHLNFLFVFYGQLYAHLVHLKVS
jgi:hypothetical protein